MEFKNLKELMTYLKDERVCREYYALLRWGGNPICPHCNHSKPYVLNCGKLYRCSSKTCKKNFTVTVGTIFEKSKISLATWMGAVFVLSAHKKGISSLQLARDLGVTQKTGWFILHRIRHIMGDPDPVPLDNIVEIDETYVGGKFGNMNQGKRKEWQEKKIDNKVAVMGIVQREQSTIVERPNKNFPDKIVKEKVIEKEGKVRLTVIGKSSFKDVVRDNVNPNAIVMTDSHLSYQGLAVEFAGHHTVNHKEMQFKDGIANTNTVEGFFSSLKRSIFGIYHQVSPKHLAQYCNETSYRYNTRKMTDKDRFIANMKAANGHRLTYNTLIQKEPSKKDVNFKP